MRDGAETKRRIERAALHLFVEKGVTQTTIRDITKAVGITEGALYRHFESKDELASTLFVDNYQTFAEELERTRNSQSGIVNQMTAMIRMFCAFFDRDPDLFSYLLLAQHDAGRQAPADIKSPVNVVRRTIADAVDRGDVEAGDTEFLTSVVLGIVLQVAISKIYGHLDGDLSSRCEAISAACTRAIGL